MIGLIAAGREGGGPESTVFFTVPWAPWIAERGQMPGRVFRQLIRMRDCLTDDVERGHFETLSDTALLALALHAKGFDMTAALGIVLARRMLRDLGIPL